MLNKIYPCLWFNGNAAEAADYYCSVFRNSEILDSNLMVVLFRSAGQKFMCLSGGRQFSFNPSTSFYVVCETRDEVDRYSNALANGGKIMMPRGKYDWSERYGWVQDEFGEKFDIFQLMNA